MRLRSNRAGPQFEWCNSNAPAEERRALDELFTVTYQELRRLANSIRRGDPGATLTPTALVNEAWLKLAKSPGIGAASELHFKRIAARAMRQLLVEAARRRNSQKRSYGNAVSLAMPDSTPGDTAFGEDVLALDKALEELAHLEPRQAAIVEARFFGGLDVAETAALAGVSEVTVHREWRAARAWLSRKLRAAQQSHNSEIPRS